MLGDRLKLARKRAGLSLRALATRLEGKISAQAISKYKSGQMFPSAGILVALAKTLGVSLDFLMSNQVSALDGVEFRAHAGVSATERARAEAAVIDQIERFLAIDAILSLNSEDNDLPPATQGVSTFEQVENLALGLREQWNLGLDPIPNMAALLEEKGVKVVVADLPQKVSGLTGAVKRPGGQTDVPVIVVSRHFTLERRRFTLAHELAHRIIGSTAGDLKHEKAMDRFAAAFLMPQAHVKRDVVGARDVVPPYCELIRLKQSYGVAAVAMVMRLRDIGVLSDATVAYVFQTCGRTWRTAEPEPLNPQNQTYGMEEPQRFERLVYWALAERLISLPRAAELLRRSVSDIEIAVRGPAVGDACHHP